MHYAAWESRMSTPDSGGSAARESYRYHAQRGRADAITMLDGPPFPEALRYLWEWFRELRRGLGEGLNGVAPLTWLALDAWQRLTGNTVEPHEANALFSLDAVMRNPDALELA